MKRSKVFLGITTALLAVAGVTAAKHYGTSKPRLYITNSKTACLEQTGILCTQGGTVQCTFQTAGHSVINLYTDGPSGTKTSSNCTSLLKYHTEH